MATVNFSVPDDVKEAFDQTFGDRNKSAVIAELMRQAVRNEALNKRREKLFRQLSSGRARRSLSTAARIRGVRDHSRS
ncbi:MAG: hypothetical protein ABI356_09715 [Steroidobacteraceae bacterium]